MVICCYIASVHAWIPIMQFILVELSDIQEKLAIRRVSHVANRAQVEIKNPLKYCMNAFVLYHVSTNIV